MTQNKEQINKIAIEKYSFFMKIYFKTKINLTTCNIKSFDVNNFLLLFDS